MTNEAIQARVKELALVSVYEFQARMRRAGPGPAMELPEMGYVRVAMFELRKEAVQCFAPGPPDRSGDEAWPWGPSEVGS